MTYQIQRELGTTRVTIPSRKNRVVAEMLKGRWWARLLAGLIVVLAGSAVAFLVAIFGLAWWADKQIGAANADSAFASIAAVGLIIWISFWTLRDLAWAVNGEELWDVDDTEIKVSRYISVGTYQLPIALPKKYTLYKIQEIMIGVGIGIMGSVKLRLCPKIS